MPSKAEVMALVKDGKTAEEICDMYPDCDQEKLKAMIADSQDSMDEGLDPVGQADADIDNDGDVDDSDKYLKMRRKAIKKALSKKED
jgi:hypothetical protein